MIKQIPDAPSIVPDADADVKKTRGWPKGKPRGPRLTKEKIAAAADRAAAAPRSLLSKMKSRPNWESEDYVGVGQDDVDRLHIPMELVEALQRDGVALQWITKSIRGREEPQEMAKYTRGGWTPVHQSDFDGLLDGRFMPKGQDDVITVDDCILVARPTEIDSKARMATRRDSSRPLQIVEESLGRGIPNVTGASHHTATRGNHINKRMERIEIPE
jgi:hypothetical protein